jgi:hypothetical protein
MQWGQAFLDLALITLLVTGFFAVLGSFEFILDALERVGRRARGLPVSDGDDRDGL